MYDDIDDSSLKRHIGPDLFDPDQVFGTTHPDRDLSGSFDTFAGFIAKQCNAYATAEASVEQLPWCHLNIGLRRPFWNLIANDLHSTIDEEYSDVDQNANPQSHNIRFDFEVLSPNILRQRLLSQSIDMVFRYEDLSDTELWINDRQTSGNDYVKILHRTYDAIKLWTETLFLVTTDPKLHDRPKSVSTKGTYIHIDRGVQPEVLTAYEGLKGITRPRFSLHSSSLAFLAINAMKPAGATACILSSASQNVTDAILNGDLHIVPYSKQIKRSAYLIFRRFDNHPFCHHRGDSIVEPPERLRANFDSKPPRKRDAGRNRSRVGPSYFRTCEGPMGTEFPTYSLDNDKNTYETDSQRWRNHTNLYRESPADIEETLKDEYEPAPVGPGRKYAATDVLRHCLIANAVQFAKDIARTRGKTITDREDEIRRTNPALFEHLDIAGPATEDPVYPSVYPRIDKRMVYTRNHIGSLEGRDAALVPLLPGEEERHEHDFVRTENKKVSRAWFSEDTAKPVGTYYADCADEIMALTRRYEDIERQASVDRWGIIRIGFRRPLWDLIVTKLIHESQHVGFPILDPEAIKVGFRFELLSPFTIQQRMSTRSIDLAFRYGEFTASEKMIHDEPGDYDPFSKTYKQQTYSVHPLWTETLYLVTNEPERFGSLDLINENRGYIHIDRGINTEIQKIYKDHLSIRIPSLNIHHASLAFDKMMEDGGAIFLSNASNRGVKAIRESSPDLYRVKLDSDRYALPMCRDAQLIYKSPHHPHIEPITISTGETRYVLKGEKDSFGSNDERWANFLELICMPRPELLEHLETQFHETETADGFLMPPGPKFLERALIANLATIAGSLASEVRETIDSNDRLFRKSSDTR